MISTEFGPRPPRVGECYCHIPPDLLVQIVREKYIERVPTIELLKKYPSERERRHVYTIALLDVPEAEVRELFKNDADFLAHFLFYAHPAWGKEAFMLIGARELAPLIGFLALFFAAWPMLAAYWALFVLRDQDMHYTVSTSALSSPTS